MPREFSLAHLTLLNCNPPDLIEVAARAQFQYVSLRPLAVTPNEPKYPLGTDKALLAQTKKRLKDTGVRLLDIELARILPNVNLKDYVPAMEAAAELGGRFLLCSVWTPDTDYALERFIELCDLARPFGLDACLEFVTFADVADLTQAARFVRAAARPNAKICIDTLHFYRSRCSLAELDQLPQDWFPFQQLCDAEAAIPDTREGLIETARENRNFLGEGGLDVAGLVNRLPPMPYAIEVPNRKLALELSPLDFARRALATANSYLDAHPRPHR